MHYKHTTFSELVDKEADKIEKECLDGLRSFDDVMVASPVAFQKNSWTYREVIDGLRARDPRWIKPLRKLKEYNDDLWEIDDIPTNPVEP